jgi:hypothetical protein
MRILGVTASGFFSGSDFELISTTILPSSQASVVFNNLGDYSSTYKHLQIRGMTNTNYGSNDQGYLSFQCNGDTASNYTRHQLTGSGASAGGYGAGSLTNGVIGFDSLSGSRTTTMCVQIIDILDYASTSKFKTLRGLSGQDFNGSGDVGLFSGLWRNSGSAITSIKLYSTNGNLRQYSTFALYGIKG